MLSKKAIRVVGLSLLTALMTAGVVASPAQAVPDWLVETSPGKHELVTTNNLPIATEPDVMASLVTELGGKSVKILCEEESVSEGLLEGEGRMSGTFEHKKCKFFDGEKEVGPCKPAEPIKISIKAQLFEHAGEDYVLVLPSAGSKFATINLGEECAFGESISLEGSLVVKDCSIGNLRVLALRHLIERARTESGEEEEGLFEEGAHVSQLTINGGSKTATLLGSTWIKLTSDKRWKAMPLLNVL